jgi:hypothetical protein
MEKASTFTLKGTPFAINFMMQLLKWSCCLKLCLKGISHRENGLKLSRKGSKLKIQGKETL